MHIKTINGIGYVYVPHRGRRGKAGSQCLGPATSLDRAMIADLKSRAEEARARRLAEDEEIDAREAATVAMFARVEHAVRAALEAAGYHKSNRGPWRKRRMSNVMSAELSVGPRYPATTRIADKHDGQMDALGTIFEPLSRLMAVQRAIGSLRFADTDEGQVDRQDQAERCFRDMERVSAALTGPDPSLIEFLVAERLAYCQFDLHTADVRVELASTSGSPSATEAAERRRERAERRYLRALKALAQVRKLDLRGVQVNIGETQLIAQVNAPLSVAP